MVEAMIADEEEGYWLDWVERLSLSTLVVSAWLIIRAPPRGSDGCPARIADEAVVETALFNIKFISYRYLKHFPKSSIFCNPASFSSLALCL